MNFQKIENQLKELTFDWFLDKQKFYKLEPYYNPVRDIIEVKYDIHTECFEDDEGNSHPQEVYQSYDKSFIGYCLNSNFENSLYINNTEYDEVGPVDVHNLPIDVEPIVNNILEYLENNLKNVHELHFQNLAINKTIEDINKAFDLPQAPVTEYEKCKNSLYKYIKKAINEEHGYLLSLYKLNTSIQDKAYKELSPEVCDQICNIQYNARKFVDEFTPKNNNTITAGQYLYDLLKANPTTTLKGAFSNEWKPNLFHTVWYLLSDYLEINFQNLEDLKCFYCGEKPFSYKAYRAAKSRITKVPNNIPQELKNQVAAIFKL